MIAVFERIPIAYRSLANLITKLHLYLLRYGYINHGVFRAESDVIGSTLNFSFLYCFKITYFHYTKCLKQLVFYQIFSETGQKNNYRVIVIGAGLSGLVCARQLKYFGFHVMIIESRERCGGRAYTYSIDKNRSADIGAEFIYGASKLGLD